MDEFLSDKEQAERLKKWWLENYKSILAGVIIAAAIIFGWRWWQHRTQVRSLTASMMYNQMGSMLATNNGPPALKMANELINNYSDTPYASQAALAMAQHDIGMDKPDDAMQMLTWVFNNSKDEGLKLLANLRLARVKLMVGDPQAALDVLTRMQPGGFAALYDELRGDAYLKLGQVYKARAAYQQALNQWTVDMGDKSLVQMKLDNLAQTPVTVATKPPVAGTHSGASKP
ncbi:MAG TPA: tetratricopeptide repeat protein [Gammaproteobacteria bacterium]|nr:tetratricopeptide repeat protein [Gammaproteobacteria bacterium]